MSTKQYECEACLVTSPATSWGPGWITCPNCGFVARTVYEKLHNLRAPKMVPVVIPLGYEQCSIDKADTYGENFLVIWNDGKKWSDVFHTSLEHVDVDDTSTIITVRCILPLEVASHWGPAPGKTHKEQRDNAFPMGQYGTPVYAAYNTAYYHQDGHAFRTDKQVLTVNMDAMLLCPHIIPLVPYSPHTLQYLG